MTNHDTSSGIRGNLGSGQRWHCFIQSILVPLTLSIGLCACTPADPGSAAPELSVLNVTELESLIQDAELLGRDGGYSVMRQGVSTWVFGDGFFSVPNAEGETFLSNSWSQTVDLDASDGIDLGLAQRDDSNRPQELFKYTDEELNFIVSAGVQIVLNHLASYVSLYGQEPWSMIRPDNEQLFFTTS